MNSFSIDRRRFLAGGAVLTAATASVGLRPAWAMSTSPGLANKGFGTLTGNDIRLTVDKRGFTVNGRQAHAIALNGTIPAPLVRLKEGETVRLTVDNRLDEDTSIHWHGLLVPFQMDGVPGISFPGIAPRTAFTYEFPIIQSGTYWYHIHSGLQEQLGHYGPIVIDPAEPDPIAFDREHVIVLSDWSFLHPHSIVTMLKKEGGVINRQKSTLTEPVRLPPGGAITDVKGDRGLHPNAQVQHKDFYVRVVDRQKDGIYVSGAKMHISAIPASNEIIVSPCRAHGEKDKDYAVVFATPLNAEGITLLPSPAWYPETGEEAEWNWPVNHRRAGVSECMIIFENVFVPWNRVFMCGEWQYSRDEARMFGVFHRLFGTCHKVVFTEQAPEQRH